MVELQEFLRKAVRTRSWLLASGSAVPGTGRLSQMASHETTGFLSDDEETALRKAIHANCPERMPEFDLGVNTGMRLSEQYGLLWEHVSIPLRMLTIPRGKNGSMRHVPLNRAAVQALEELRKRHKDSEFICGGVREPRRWFEPVLA